MEIQRNHVVHLKYGFLESVQSVDYTLFQPVTSHGHFYSLYKPRRKLFQLNFYAAIEKFHVESEMAGTAENNKTSPSINVGWVKIPSRKAV